MTDSAEQTADLLRQALVYEGAGQLERARQVYVRALQSQPQDTSIYNRLGLVLQKEGKIDEALTCYGRALAIDSGDATAHYNRGVALFEQELLVDAAASFERSIASEPASATAHNNLGYTLYCMGQYVEAERHYGRALELEPDLVDANWNLCILHLLMGDLRAGWERFTYRHAMSPFPRRVQTKPSWEGQPLSGQTILLYKESGLGDTIQFARYAPLVAERGARVVFEVQPELMRLFQTLDGVDLLVKRGAQLPEFDYECSIMDLPRIFGTTLQLVPAAPYLSANPILARRWHKQLGPGFKAGLVWAGNPKLPNDRHRSISVTRLEPLLSTDVHWISLQKGPAAAQASDGPAGMRLLPLGEKLDDFAETAAVIENLDLVITVDTSVAHLGGALGKRVWLLLPFVPDWRWLAEREDSPWYPGMRLFRQTEFGNWSSVIERVARELRALPETQRPRGVIARLKHGLRRFHER
ncbi:MAG: hypothetical protein QOK44_1534 [Betaproteobacteria bacterium]|nr:hypothetical protein [Betaproteobacteria bacterium]